MSALGSNYRKLIAASAASNLGDGVAQIAYPWLASAITRSPLLIAGVAVARGLPWIFFSLPSGVITDRNDRRTLMWTMNAFRTVVTLVVAIVVLARSDALPSPDALADPATAVATQWPMYALIVLATIALGCAEVLHDNAGTSFMPQVVDSADLEKANGRLWSVEAVANQFVGPLLGAFLLGTAYALPFFFDAGTFAVAAALVGLISVAKHVPMAPDEAASSSWTNDVKEGFEWLWAHKLLKDFAIILGCFNALIMMTTAVFILFAQDVLGATSTEFALMIMGGAVGGVLAGLLAERVTTRFAPGFLVLGTLYIHVLIPAIQGSTSFWVVFTITGGVSAFLGTIWNVITVSLRQRLIPDELLGRVNSVYRFFGLGMAPLGGLLGGLVATVFDVWFDRDIALRYTWFMAAGLTLLLALYARPRLNTAQFEAAERAHAESVGGSAT